jgi:hypothetical protein
VLLETFAGEPRAAAHGTHARTGRPTSPTPAYRPSGAADECARDARDDDLRPRLRGLAPLPAAVAADPARQSSVLAFEFHGFMSAVEHGSIARRSGAYGRRASRRRADPITLTWLEAGLRLRQPDGGLTPDGLRAARTRSPPILTPDGRALASTRVRRLCRRRPRTRARGLADAPLPPTRADIAFIA